MKPGPAVFGYGFPKVTTLSGCDITRHTTRAELSAEKQAEVHKAQEIAGRYAIEAERELRPAYRANFERIAASYRQLAEEVAK